MAGAVEKAAEKAEGKATAATWDLFEKLFEQAIGFQADIELALANDNIRAATAARREKSRLLDMLHRFRDANRLSADDFLRAQVNWAQVTAGVAKEFMTEEQHAVFCEKLQAALREVRV